jgi:hypothetical protein
MADTLRVPLFTLAYGLLLFTLWQNRGYPGLALAFVGVASNALVIMVNGGYMPVWPPAYVASGLSGPLVTVLHVPLPILIGPEFLLSLGPLADVIPIPIPPVNNVASIGDLFLTAGLSFFLFSTVLRSQEETRAAIDEAKTGRYLGVAGTARLPTKPPAGPGEQAGAPAEILARTAIAEDSGWAHFPPGETVTPLAISAGTGLVPSLEEAAALERPLILGGGSVGMASPALAPLPAEEASSAAAMALSAATAATVGAASAVPRVARPTRLEGVREHPYVRLALNGSFSALWMGQVISLFGDRVNQLALIAFVFEITDSPLAVALTFLASTIPNLLFSLVAGAFVDRWDQKQVLVVSDIIRCARPAHRPSC